MDDNPKIPPHGVNLSAYIKDIKVDSTEAFSESFGGLKQMGPITITGYFDDGRVTCGNCGARFWPCPEGTPTVTHQPSGVSFIACPDCAVAVLGLESNGG